MTVIYIEIIVVLIILAMFGFWFIWVTLSKKYHNWRYNPKNDRGKIGEEHRQELVKKGRPDPIREVRESITADSSRIELPEGQGEPEGRTDIPTTEPNSPGKDRSGVRKFIKNPFKPRK